MLDATGLGGLKLNHVFVHGCCLSISDSGTVWRFITTVQCDTKASGNEDENQGQRKGADTAWPAITFAALLAVLITAHASPRTIHDGMVINEPGL